MHMPGSENSFKPDPTGQVKKIRDESLALRPSPASVSWPAGREKPAGAVVPTRGVFVLAKGEERRFLSLRALASKVGVADAALSEECRTLAGIGYVEGFMLGEADDPDVILVGRKSPNRPALRLDDLVVNLRAAGQAGGYPYCSLDPVPESVRALQAVLGGTHSLATKAEVEALFQKIKAAVGPQQVVVGGVPRNSRHAHVMIDADYHMKMISQGLVKAEGVTSSIDRALNEAKDAAKNGKAMPAAGLSMARFWFHVGDGGPAFFEEPGAVWIDKCDVVVLTEKQMASSDGRLRDSHQDDPSADAFAAEFSKAFPKLTAEVRVYADLENLFRLQALLLAMEHRHALSRIGVDCDSYLRPYQYRDEAKMRASLPGLANYGQWSYRTTIGNREAERFLFPIVCGGVGMDMHVAEKSFRSSAGGGLAVFRKAALGARPSRDALSWTARSP